MCQISAKPVRVEKNAVMDPVGLFRGISIGSYLGSGDNCCVSIARCFMSQYGSAPRTLGSTAKLKGGGGEVVAHSSERPSQGSPVSSRNSSRRRTLTTN